MASWENTSFQNENRVRLNELIKILDITKVTKFKAFRYFDTPNARLQKIAQVWLPIYKDGKPVISQKGKPVNIPFNITNFDPETETFDETRECPFVKASETIRKYIKDDKVARQFTPQISHIAQAINRDLQENPDKKGKPSKKERASGFKESIDSDSFTPVECHQLNFSIGQQLESIKETNTVVIKDKAGNKKKVNKSVADSKYGRDVMIKYDANAQGVSKYKVQPGERTPLNQGDYQDEDKYLVWDVISAIKETTLSPKEAKVEAERLVKEFLKSVKGKKSNSDDDDDDDEDLPDDIEASSSKSSKKKKGGKKAEIEDEDDDEDLDLEDDDSDDSDDDEDEDDTSSKKSSKKGSSSKKKKPVDKKSNKKKSSKKPSKDEDDEEEDSDDDDDEDEDDDEELEIELDDDDDDD